MHALIEQFPSARDLWIGAPFLVVAEPASVAVARPDVHRADGALVERAHLLDRGVKE
jgi:hypothetical protein